MEIDMAKASFQLRGHCQCCGSEQAVRNGVMAHHGYTVKNGWFQGKCRGYQYAPVELRRNALDDTIEMIRDQITTLSESADMLSSPSNWPKEVKIYNRFKRVDEMVPLASLPEYRAREVINGIIWGYRNRIEAGKRHIEYLKVIAATYFNKPLIQIDRAA
jgi:hypothetical protein